MQRRKRPRGLTILEFVGCFAAVVGGAWLGALYLGVDVKNVAVKAISQSEILDRMPAEWRPAVPQENVMTREQVVSTLRQELGTLRGEINALRSGKTETTAGDSTSKETDSASQLPTKEKTLAYWSRLNEIALRRSRPATRCRIHIQRSERREGIRDQRTGQPVRSEGRGSSADRGRR